MRRFLLQSLLFLLVGMIPVWLLVQVSKRYPSSFDEQVSMERIEAVTANLARLEALSVGSSHARAIDFDHLGLRGQELGLPWNDAAEVEFQIRTLAPRMPRLRVAFIAVSYFSFHWSNAHAGDGRYLASRRLFYSTTPFLRWIHGDFDTFVEGKTYWLARPDNWYWVLAPLAGRDVREEQEAEYYEDRIEEKEAEELIEHAERRVSQTLETMSRILETHPGAVTDNYAALSSTIALLRERGVRVVLFTPPFYERYLALYAGEPTLAEMRRLAARLSGEHGVEYYDFSADEISADPQNFRDSDHLNFRGKERFSPKLAAAMRNGGGLANRGYAAPSSRE